MRPVILVTLAVLLIVGFYAAFQRDAVPNSWWRLTWRVDPAYPISPETRVVHVLANEGNCSGTETASRLQPPVIKYQPSAIDIALYVSPHSSLALSCGDVPVTVELSEAVGARELTGVGAKPLANEESSSPAVCGRGFTVR